jgi:hypothetical protein
MRTRCSSRWFPPQRIDIHATAFAGMVIITAVIVGFVVEMAKAATAIRSRGSAPSVAWPT